MRIDQRANPDDFGNGRQWEIIAVVTMENGATDLTVELSDDADGYVIADSMRIDVPDPNPLHLAGSRLVRKLRAGLGPGRQPAHPGPSPPGLNPAPQHHRFPGREKPGEVRSGSFRSGCPEPVPGSFRRNPRDIAAR